MAQAQYSGSRFYRIVVQGRIGPDLSDRFGSMLCVAPPSDTKLPVAVLEGRVRDQAELSGILNTLYELRFSLISVSSLD